MVWASVAHGYFLSDLAAAITGGGWIDKDSSIATHTTPSMGVGRLPRFRMELRRGGRGYREAAGWGTSELVNIEMEERERTSLALPRRRTACHLPARTNIIDGGGGGG